MTSTSLRTVARPDEDAARDFLERWSVPLDWSGCSEPDLQRIQAFLERAAAGAPGPDGLPFLAWLAQGDIATRVLERVLSRMIAGSRMPFEFGQSLLVYPPKGIQAHEGNSVVREPSDTLLAADPATLNYSYC